VCRFLPEPESRGYRRRRSLASIRGARLFPPGSGRRFSLLNQRRCRAVSEWLAEGAVRSQSSQPARDRRACRTRRCPALPNSGSSSPVRARSSSSGRAAGIAHRRAGMESAWPGPARHPAYDSGQHQRRPNRRPHIQALGAHPPRRLSEHGRGHDQRHVPLRAAQAQDGPHIAGSAAGAGQAAERGWPSGSGPACSPAHRRPRTLAACRSCRASCACRPRLTSTAGISTRQRVSRTGAAQSSRPDSDASPGGDAGRGDPAAARQSCSILLPGRLRHPDTIRRDVTYWQSLVSVTPETGTHPEPDQLWRSDLDHCLQRDRHSTPAPGLSRRLAVP
jgi:hypothetical protein